VDVVEVFEYELLKEEPLEDELFEDELLEDESSNDIPNSSRYFCLCLLPSSS
jgi:hypothetical protein